MAHVHRRERNGVVRFIARYIDPATGKERSKSFRTEQAAERFLQQHEVAMLTGRAAPVTTRVTFARWAEQWWQLWASDPDRSPTTLSSSDSRLRRHVRPAFDRLQLHAITPALVRQWQNELRGRLDHGSVMACRSLLHSILQAAEDEQLITVNPVRKVPPPRRPVDPDVILGAARPRTLTPVQVGDLLAAMPSGYRDHFLCLVGTGLRAGEFCGLTAERIDLARRRLEVVTVRIDAGRFGRGYKPRPKSNAGIRHVPLADAVSDALARHLAGPKRSGPVFPRLDRTGRPVEQPLSRYDLRRVYLAAFRQARGQAKLGNLDLRGPHDLRHTFATWLEDAGIPARVIDELMGHAASRRVHGTSPMGSVYRHTTPAMEARVIEALNARLDVVVRALDPVA